MLAFFSTCTDNIYLEYTITSLLSYKKTHPNSDLFVCGNFKEESVKKIRKSGVKEIIIDYSDIFVMRSKSKYPSECFWWTGVPEILGKMGYKKVIYVDGDTLSLKEIPEKIINSVDSLGGYYIRSLARMLTDSDSTRRRNNSKARPIIKVLNLDISSSLEERKKNKLSNMHLNTGVIIFSTQWAKEYELFKKSVNLIKEIRNKGEYWDGDDSFLALLCLYYTDFKTTNIPYLQYINGIGKRQDFDKFHIFHMISEKPWKPGKSDFLYKQIDSWRSNIPEFLTIYNPLVIDDSPKKRKLEREKLEREKLEREKLEREKLEREKLEREKLEREKLEREKLEREKLQKTEKINLDRERQYKKLIEKSNKNPIPIWWMEIKNFGDWLTPYIYKKIKGISSGKATKSSKIAPSVFGVGSIIAQVNDNSIVWGSGISSLSGKPVSGNIKVLSTRGPITRRRLINLNIPVPEKYGDPGLMVPILYNPLVTKKYKLGIIPHYVDNGIFKNHALKNNPDILFINLDDTNIERVIDKILSCEKTISSSLHGIILSVAYGIPTRWAIFSNKIYGDSIKYWDFFLSLRDKSNHGSEISLVLEIVNQYNKTGKFPDDSKYDKLKMYYPLVYKSVQNFTYDNIINKPELYKITSDLIENIIETCPF